MSRVSYGEDEDFNNQSYFWEHNAELSLSGRKGVRVLRDLRDALLALPRKRLIANALASDGDVCTVGALVVAKRVAAGADREAVLAEYNAEAQPVGCLYCFHKPHPGVDCPECARLGAAAQQRNPELTVPSWMSCKARNYEPDYDDSEQGDVTRELAQKYGGANHYVAWSLVELNDEQFKDATPEERYTRVLAWVEQKIEKAERKAAAAGRTV